MKSVCTYNVTNKINSLTPLELICNVAEWIDVNYIFGKIFEQVVTRMVRRSFVRNTCDIFFSFKFTTVKNDFIYNKSCNTKWTGVVRQG